MMMIDEKRKVIASISERLFTEFLSRDMLNKNSFDFDIWAEEAFWEKLKKED